MKIIIIENELYLAQSIASKLNDNHFKTEIYSTIKDALSSKGDVYLLSTNLPGQNHAPLIKKFSDKIIILMVSYINNNTVSEPLKLGAKDYIVKPFMIEELLRKIEHYKEFQELRQKSILFQKYTSNLLKDIEHDYNIEQLNPPVVISSNYQRLADKIVFAYAQKVNQILIFVSVYNENWKEQIDSSTDNNLMYITDVDTLKKSEKETLFKLLENCNNFIISTTANIDSPYESISIMSDSKLYDQNEILTIDDYVKFIVKSFQYQFPDTELSNKLGISRKSLWEKRKKYGIFKKK